MLLDGGVSSLLDEDGFAHRGLFELLLWDESQTALGRLLGVRGAAFRALGAVDGVCPL